MNRSSDTYDRASEAYRNARIDAHDAQEIVHLIAVDIADQVLEPGRADPKTISLYTQAKEMAEQKDALVR